MAELFLNLLNMSITASWLVLAVIILRFLLKKVPKYIICVLWALVAVRLICPISFESYFSLVPSVETVPSEIQYAKHPQVDTGIQSLDFAINPIIQENFTPTNELTSMNPIQLPIYIGAYLWQIGVVVMLLYAVISYVRVRFRVRERVKIEGNIYICDRIPSPFILGIIRPKIYLPSSLSEDETSHVIAHEKAHIKRLDYIWKPLGYILLTVYWFNPVMWLSYILLCRDIEYACDEKVVKEMNVDKKKEYSQTLLNLSIHDRYVTACPLAFGESGVKSRIKSVLNYKKPAFWVIAVAVILCVVMAVCFLTNPIRENIVSTTYADANEAVIDEYIGEYIFRESLESGSDLDYVIIMYYNEGLNARFFSHESSRSGYTDAPFLMTDYICNVKLTDKGATLYLKEYAENHNSTAHSYPIGTELLTLKVNDVNVYTYWKNFSPVLEENYSDTECFARAIVSDLFACIHTTEFMVAKFTRYDPSIGWFIPNDDGSMIVPANGYPFEKIQDTMKEYCSENVTKFLLKEEGCTISDDGIVNLTSHYIGFTYNCSMNDIKLLTDETDSTSGIATALVKWYNNKQDAASPYETFIYSFEKKDKDTFIITNIEEYIS